MRAVLVAAAAVAVLMATARRRRRREGMMQTYVARAFDGSGWSCPAGTEDTGDRDSSKACAIP